MSKKKRSIIKDEVGAGMDAEETKRIPVKAVKKALEDMDVNTKGGQSSDEELIPGNVSGAAENGGENSKPDGAYDPGTDLSGAAASQEAAAGAPGSKKKRKVSDDGVVATVIEDTPKKKKRGPLKKSTKIALSCLLVLLVAVLGVGSVFAYRVMINPQNLFNKPSPLPAAAPTPADPSPIVVVDDDPLPVSPAPTPTPDEYELMLAAADKSMMKNIVNVMVIGVDYANERSNWKKYFYSDVMIILAINFDENKVDMISVPRDTYANIYNVEGKYKMNSSFYWGGGWEKDGFLYTMKSCQWILGDIPIDYYIGATMPVVKELVDAIGGVDYDIDVNFKIQGRKYEKGMTHLDGQGVLDYFRVRKGVDNDLGRVNRQKKLLIAAFTKLKSTNMIFKAPEIVRAMEGRCFTNMSFEQMCALAAFGSKLPVESIKMHTMKGPLINIYNWNFVITDQEDRVALIKEVYGVDVPKMPKYSYSYCRNEWETMQASKYISYVNSAISKDQDLETPKLTSDEVAELRAAVSQCKAALGDGATEIADAKDSLQSTANHILGNKGIKINWFVNENPGKKRLTG